MATDDGENLRQAVFGANDGLVSTFGLLAGLVGAAVPQALVILASIINMIAAGMSMGLGSYLATKSERELNERIREQELATIRTQRTKAEAELLFLLREKNLSTKHAQRHASEIMKNETIWLNVVLEEKHGLGRASFHNPAKSGVIMFIVFVACGLIPIIPLFFSSGNIALGTSAILTAVALFVVGALKHQLTGKSFWKLGAENLLIGAITGTVGFVAGYYTAGWIS